MKWRSLFKPDACIPTRPTGTGSHTHRSRHAHQRAGLAGAGLWENGTLLAKGVTMKEMFLFYLGNEHGGQF